MDIVGVILLIFLLMVLYVFVGLFYSMACAFVGKGFIASIKRTGLSYSGTWVTMVLTAIGCFAMFIYSESSSNSESNSNSSNSQSTYVQTRLIGKNTFGCLDKDYLKKLIRYNVDNDTDAFNRYLGKARADGQCTTFAKDEPVFLSDTEIMAGFIKIRRKGEESDYWTFMEAVH